MKKTASVEVDNIDELHFLFSQYCRTVHLKIQSFEFFYSANFESVWMISKSTDSLEMRTDQFSLKIGMDEDVIMQ